MELKEEALDKSTPITQLDSQILTDLVFGPILGITDLKKDNRIDFVGGIRGHKELERRCQLDCVAAIALHPCSIDELLCATAYFARAYETYGDIGSQR